MRVLCREHKRIRTRATFHNEGFVDAGSQLEQCLHSVDLPFAYRKEERGKTTIRTRIHVSAMLEQETDYAGIPFGSRPHQRRLPPPVFLRVDIRAVVNE